MPVLLAAEQCRWLWLQKQYGKATGQPKTASQKAWQQAQALRERLNKQVSEAEGSIQSAYSSASGSLNDAWKKLKAQAEL